MAHNEITALVADVQQLVAKGAISPEVGQQIIANAQAAPPTPVLPPAGIPPPEEADITAQLDQFLGQPSQQIPGLSVQPGDDIGDIGGALPGAIGVQPTLPVGIPDAQQIPGLSVQPTLPVGIPQAQQIGADAGQVDAQFEALQRIIAGIGTQFIDPAAVRGAIQAIPGIAPADVEAFFSTARKSFPSTFGGPDVPLADIPGGGGGTVSIGGNVAGTPTPVGTGAAGFGTGVGGTVNAGTAGAGNDFFNFGPDVNTGPGNAVFDQNGIPITPGDIRGIASETRTGRRGLFGGFVANQLATANPQVRTAIGRQFDPLSARFVLEQLVNSGNTGAGNFRDFLGSGRTGFNPGQFNAAFNSLGGLFNGNQPAAGLDEGQLSSVQRLGGATGQNIASSFIGSQLNPFLRGNVSDIVGNRFASFGDRNPLANPFGAFLSNRSLSGF